MKRFWCVGLMLVSVSLHAQLADFRHVRFDRADSVADANFDESLYNLPELSRKLTQSLKTEEEKFRSIFKWVCGNIAFDFELFRLNRDKRNKYDSREALTDWNKKALPMVYRNLIEHKRTLCTGYAWLVQELARHAGIACVIVDGYGRNASINIRKADKANHSWNAVKLNGKWYLCDPTWASGVHDREGEFIRKYDDAYFLTNPSVFIRNHYPLDPRWTLLETEGSKSITPTLEEFLNAPLIYSNAYKHGITRLYPATFDIVTEKNEPVNFRFESNASIQCVELLVSKDQHSNSYEPEYRKDSEGLYSFNHTFSEKGRHILHVRLNDSYSFTYTVIVK